MTDSSRPGLDALPKSWDPGAVESDLYEGWVNAGYFKADASTAKPAYSIVLPPPNVTGSLHMGHALDHTLMDALTRRKRMQGYEVLWLPGMDHAGIATQSVVEKQLAVDGKTKEDFGRELFIDKVWDWKHESGGTIGGQMRRLGDGVDWSRDRFTMDDGLSRAVRTIFKRLFDAGLIYRAERLVNWSPVLETAVSDLEVKYEDVEGELVSFRYGSMRDDEPHIVVATTRVETMLGDTAIAVHPDDERYRDLVGKTLPHPFVDRELIIVADAARRSRIRHGRSQSHTGARSQRLRDRHAASVADADDHGHQGPDRRHRNANSTGWTASRPASRCARRWPQQGRVVAEKRPYLHSVGHSERSGEPIEPRLSLQWWVKVESLAKAAGDAVRNGDTVIHPASLEPRWFALGRRHARLVHLASAVVGPPHPDLARPDGDMVCVGPDETPPEGWEQDPDVLDTWFSSALWPFSTMGWPDHTPELEKFYPTSVLVTGYDILFFWVARMMMFGTFVADDPAITLERQRGPQVPFENVFLHGLIRDEFGRKMSKSARQRHRPAGLGREVRRRRAAVHPGPRREPRRRPVHRRGPRSRLAKLRHQAVQRDPVRVDERRRTGSVARSGANSPTPTGGSSAGWKRFAPRWIRRSTATSSAGHANRSTTSPGTSSATGTWSWPRCSSPDGVEHTTAVLAAVLDSLLKLLHPVMPFVTEVLWKTLTGGESLVIADWPRAVRDSRWIRVATQRITDMQKLITEVRRFRSDQGLNDRQRVPARLSDVAKAGLDAQLPAVSALAWLTAADDGFSPSAAVEVRLSQGTVVVELDTSGTVDVAAERRRLEKDLAAAQKELAGTEGKLGNDAFLAKAPADVVDKIRARQQVAREEVDRITARLAGFPMTADAEIPGTVPTPDEIASLLQVEHLLDQRWPETKLEPSTTRISALMEMLGSPQRSYPSIHIAGTNGKTSVARMVDALLTALHRRTGRTTSPHLQSAVERISIDGRPITPAKYVETYREIEPFVQLVDQQSEAAGGPAMSKFEVVTGMAFAAFADAPIDVAVVEVGLGGRWDATNIVDAPVAVITPIGVDHADYLGDTIAEIAGEKAGVIKKQDDELVCPIRAPSR